MSLALQVFGHKPKYWTATIRLSQCVAIRYRYQTFDLQTISGTVAAKKSLSGH